jgi:peroxiredoxin Q/BCP
MLKIGKTAPDLSLPDADMEMVELSKFRGRNVVLFFYPKDDTPGCTLEATDFTDHEDEFKRANCVVLGISRDDCLSHADFRDKHGISVDLLADSDGDVCESYGVLREKEVDGVRRKCFVRSTFVIDADGIIRQIFDAVTPKGHVLEVLRFVRTMNS